MIRKTFEMLIAFMLVLSIASLAFARGAPTKQKAFTSNAQVATISPAVVRAPVMTGYDVIENISTESRDLSIAQNTLKVDTSAWLRLSPTVDRRSINASYHDHARSSPAIVMIA